MPLIAERLAAPQASQDVQPLVQQLGARLAVGRLAHLAEAAVVQRAKANRQNEPPARELVNRHRLARQLPGRRRENGVSIAPIRTRLVCDGDRGEHHPGVEHRAMRTRWRCHPNEDAIPASILRLARHRHDLARVAAGDDEAIA